MVESACDLSTQEAKEEGQEFKARQGYIASSRTVRVSQEDPERRKAGVRRKGGVWEGERERWNEEGRNGGEKKGWGKADKEEEERMGRRRETEG